jgi:hypothetical protein
LGYNKISPVLPLDSFEILESQVGSAGSGRGFDDVRHDLLMLPSTTVPSETSFRALGFQINQIPASRFDPITAKLINAVWSRNSCDPG